MIDHVLGRPSVKFRKFQVLTVVLLWSFYLYKGNRNGPPVIRRLSATLSRRLTPWQTVVITLIWLYITRNFGKLINLECPEPLANLYSRSYFRATWITTALDAGFWTAMHIRPKWLKDLSSMVFSVYYLFCAEQADEKVRKVRGCLTVDHLRVSWNKPTTPYLKFISAMLRPRLMRYPPRAIRIPRPNASSYTEPVHGWLYFNGPISALKKHNKIILDIPGGGFVAMTPRCHEDKLQAWAGKTDLPVLALEYRKAPENPYPYALNECYDVYHSIIATRGRCVGFSGEDVPQIVVSGDSAGGSLAVGMVLMIVQAGSTDTRRFLGETALPPPEGVVLVYPALDVNISSWMTDDQMTLIRDRQMRKTNERVLRRKSEDYKKLTPHTPQPSDDELDVDENALEMRPNRAFRKIDEDAPLTESPTAIKLTAAHTGVDSTALTKTASNGSAKDTAEQTAAVQAGKPHILKTRLAMSSMISYFNDRILSPEMMRAMIILYIGPHNRPDLSTDFLLSPLLAPENLLAAFPKTYFLTGERDPLVDDTVIFAGRIRQAKYAAWVERREMGLLSRTEEKMGFREDEHVEVVLIPGISHGFLQFVSIFPEGWQYISRCAKWMLEIFDHADRAAEENPTPAVTPPTPGLAMNGSIGGRHHRRMGTASSAEEDRPLEMTVIRPKRDSISRAHTDTGVRGNQNGERRTGEGRVEKGRPGSVKKNKSIVKLASSDDLLGRRMFALTDGLTGSAVNGDEVPPTP
ncbi:alpha/beta-hydrolase [Rhizodiscina lignyota]|uniref:Alpha/beta-hydrolase n=1 Tax=Rhizodiscina lignyota TaxID=1504668 RepID=A0A9P4ICY8_9PEZI|nr:alpha/beta-hydrolase [Rhizodiscina lignyota]